MSFRSPGARVRWVIAAAIFIGAATYCLRKVEIPNTAFFGGDTWEYQSMAVNFAAGHGLKFGSILPYGRYGFDAHIHDAYLEQFDTFIEIGKRGGEDRFYRTPAYPFLLGLLYKIAGVRPDIAMLIQMLAMIAIGSLLPFLGEAIFGWRGFVAGVPAGLLVSIFVAPYSLAIMTETLIAVACWLIFWAWVLVLRRPTVEAGAVFGLSLAFGVLVKGSLIFIPLLMLSYCVVRMATSRVLPSRLVATAVISFLLPVLAYSAWASSRTGETIILSTQSRFLLLDSHNEQTLASGQWAPQWRTDPSSEYWQRRAADPTVGSVRLVTGFYREHPSYLPKMILRKLEAAGQAPALVDWIAVNGFMAICFLFTACTAATRSASRVSRVVAVAAAFAVCAVFKADLAVSLAATGATLLAGVATNRTFAARLLRRLKDPRLTSVASVALNFLLVTIVIFADQRFQWPGYFNSLLLSGYMLIRLGEEVGVPRDLWRDPIWDQAVPARSAPRTSSSPVA